MEACSAQLRNSPEQYMCKMSVVISDAQMPCIEVHKAMVT